MLGLSRRSAPSPSPAALVSPAPAGVADGAGRHAGPGRSLADMLGAPSLADRSVGVQLVQSPEQVADLRRLVGACVDSWFETGHPWAAPSLEGDTDPGVAGDVGGHALVAYVPEPVGCVLLHVNPDGSGELTNLFVRRECRGRGVADALLEAALATAQAAGMPRVELVVSRRLESAVALFGRWGFTPVTGAQAGVVSMALVVPVLSPA